MPNFRTFTFKVLLCGTFCCTVAQSVVVPKCIQILGQRLGDGPWQKEDLEKREKEIIKTMQNDPAKLFTEIRKQAKKDFKDGQFDYPIFEPTLRLIIDDMNTRVKEPLKEEDKKMLQQLIQKGEQLLQAGVPYKDSMRFTFKYTTAMDTIFLRLHPELGGTFHRTNAEHVLEKALARGPDVLLLPSFQSVGFTFFNASRAAPLHVIGLHPSGLREGEEVPFADGYDMMPSEFAWHDVGHIEYMADKDFEYIDTTFKPIERVVQEWDFTRKRVRAFHNTQKPNKNLFDATTLLLFEILHERGFQYSLSVLKAQLDTPKWTEILQRKLQNGYYKRFHWVNMNLFPELENARKNLLEFIVKARAQDQKNHIAALFANDLAVRITHFPNIEYGKGMFGGIEIDDKETRLKSLLPDGKVQYPFVEHLVLAQINPTQATPFSHEAMKDINAVLHMKRAGQKVAVGQKASPINKILVRPDKSIVVVLEDKSTVPLSSISIPSSYKTLAPTVLDRHFFEMNQTLGALERNTPLHYTLHKPTKVYLGTVQVENKDGRDYLNITTNDETKQIPLEEALIDPMQKSDFDNMYIGDSQKAVLFR